MNQHSELVERIRRGLGGDFPMANDADGIWEDASAALDSLVEQLEADRETFRLIATVCGEDGTERDDWRAMTFPAHRTVAFDAAVRLRADYDASLASNPASVSEGEIPPVGAEGSHPRRLAGSGSSSETEAQNQEKKP